MRVSMPHISLHSLGGEPNLVAGCADGAGLHLQPDIFALHRIGVVDTRHSEGGGEGLKSGAALVLIDERFGRLDHVSVSHHASRFCHRLPV